MVETIRSSPLKLEVAHATGRELVYLYDVLSSLLFDRSETITRSVFSFLLLRYQLIELMLYPFRLFDAFLNTLFLHRRWHVINLFALVYISINALLNNFRTLFDIDFFFDGLRLLFENNKLTDLLGFLLERIIAPLEVRCFNNHRLFFSLEYNFGCVFMLLELSFQSLLAKRPRDCRSYLLLLLFNKVSADKTILVARKVLVNNGWIFTIFLHHLL